MYLIVYCHDISILRLNKYINTNAHYLTSTKLKELLRKSVAIHDTKCKLELIYFHIEEIMFKLYNMSRFALNFFEYNRSLK